MKSKKIVALLLLVISMMFIFYNNIVAFENSIGTISQGGTHVIDSGSGYGMAVKVSQTYGASFCTAYKSDTPAGTGTVCTLNDNWDAKVRAGVAAIINDSSSKISVTETTADYFAAELAINQFLHNKSSGGADITGSMNLGSNYKTKFNNYLNLANTAYDNYTTASLSFSSTTLTFTKQGNNYVSNTITITSVGDLNLQTNNGTLQRDGNNFYVVIPASSITLGSSLDVTVSATTSVNNYVARNYSCGSYQTLTPSRTETDPSTATTSATGSISKSYAKVKVAKVDDKDKFISGAKLMFQTEAQKTSKTDGTIITSTDNYVEIDSLVAGKYYLTEKEAPVGYDKTDEIIEIVIDNDGKIKVNGIVKDDGSLKVLNALTQTEFSKINATDGKELPGATLQVLDKDKKPILDKDGKELYKWVSTDTPFVIEGLPVGKYYLKEVIAPEGYVLNETMVEFEVKGDGTVTKVAMKNELEVEVPDTLSPRSALLLSMAMFDIALGIGILTYVKKNRIKE